MSAFQNPVDAHVKVGACFDSLSGSGKTHIFRILNARADGTFRPPIAVLERDDSFLVTADLPGLAPGDVDVVFEKGVLLLSGERRAAAKSSAGRELWSEICCGASSRTVELPEAAGGGEVSTRLRDGVLEVSVANKPRARPKRICVH